MCQVQVKNFKRCKKVHGILFLSVGLTTVLISDNTSDSVPHSDISQQKELTGIQSSDHGNERKMLNTVYDRVMPRKIELIQRRQHLTTNILGLLII